MPRQQTDITEAVDCHPHGSIIEAVHVCPSYMYFVAYTPILNWFIITFALLTMLGNCLFNKFKEGSFAISYLFSNQFSIG